MNPVGSSNARPIYLWLELFVYRKALNNNNLIALLPPPILERLSVCIVVF